MGTGDDNNNNTKIIKVKTVNFIFKSQVNINYFCLTQPHKLASTYLSKVDRKIYYFGGGKVKSQGHFFNLLFSFFTISS